MKACFNTLIVFTLVAWAGVACSEENDDVNCADAEPVCGASIDIAEIGEGWNSVNDESIRQAGIGFCAGGKAATCRAVCAGEYAAACFNGEPVCVDKEGKVVEEEVGCAAGTDQLEKAVRLQAYRDFECAPGEGQEDLTERERADIEIEAIKTEATRATAEGCGHGSVTYSCVGQYWQLTCAAEE